MASQYDVVCKVCGKIHTWCKYDPPIEECGCGAQVFGV